MAKFGLNAVRFHFLDATWGMPRLIDYESGDCRNWNADALDRLDYFIARLKEQGIYADLNLLVGRRFGVGDGVDASVNQLDWKTAHAVGFFHAPHMEAQKRYARQLLTHRNPYTKLTYAEDPAVALVEINNENGLIHTWLGGDFDALPEVFALDLRKQWNAWLAGRYAGTAALSKAWGARNEPLARRCSPTPGWPGTWRAGMSSSTRAQRSMRRSKPARPSFASANPAAPVGTCSSTSRSWPSRRAPSTPSASAPRPIAPAR